MQGPLSYSASYSANQYRTNSVNTSPLQLVVMCYDGMLRFLGKTRAAIEKKDIETKVKFVNKTIAIIDELQNSLDFMRGGDVAKNLDRIYDYFNRELMKVSMHNDLDALSHVENLVRDLRASWHKIASEAPQGQPTPPNQSNITITG